MTAEESERNQISASGAPKAVRVAAILMYIGAGIMLLLGFLSIPTVLNQVRWSLDQLPSADATGGTAVMAMAAGSMIIGVVLVAGLWVWMAIMNQRGRKWARILSTVLFAVDSLFFLLTLPTVAKEPISVLPAGLVWAVGLAVIVLLWRSENAHHYGL